MDSLFLNRRGLLNYFTRNKKVLWLKSLPQVRRRKILRSYIRLIKLAKVAFWGSPLYIIMLILIHKYDSAEFFQASVLGILMYLILLRDFLYRKFLLKELDELEVGESQ